MVYCSKCGTKNEEDAKYCSKCGADLEVSREKHWDERVDEWGEEVGRRAEKWGKQMEREFTDECFGLPHGGAIAGIIFGIIILVFGFAWLTGVDIWANIGPFMAILVGLLIVAGAIYRVTRRR